MKVLSSLLVLLCVSSTYASIKISSYNIRMYGKSGEYTNASKLKQIIHEMNSDLIGVQEIVNVTKFKTFIGENFKNYKVIMSKCGGGGSQKLGVVYDSNKLELVKMIEDDSISNPKGLDDDVLGCRSSLRPLVTAFFKVRKTQKSLVAMVVHLKAGGSYTSYRKRAQQYKMLKSIFIQYEQKYPQIVMLGDFNTTGYDERTQDYDRFIDMVSGMNVYDSSQNIVCTSYWSGATWDDNIEEPSNLDHILISKELRKNKKMQFSVGAHCKQVQCKEAKRDELGETYENVSDHCPISVTIQ